MVLVAGGHHQARYLRQPGTELDLIVMAPCSVEVRTGGAAGALLYEDDLDAGDSVELPSSGSVWLRVGNPHAVTLNADGLAVSMALPATATPFELLFDTADQ
ncbi:MAG TPA: RodZ domain-containing protein [Acidimicrobiales bacterium]|nr:RodZ domain-containing protein [Acidimicrobiales bacterium]